MGKTQTTGNSGEEMTAKFLKGRGYIISARNYRSRFGEIDVIAENNEMILFVEVKTRSVKSKILPREFVDKDKQRKIRITAGIYLQRNVSGLQPRFDVAEILVNEDGSRHLKYIENAFGADGFELL